jgi:hypothetical protein
MDSDPGKEYEKCEVEQEKNISKKVDSPPRINSDDILEILARRVLNTIINEMKRENGE